MDQRGEFVAIGAVSPRRPKSVEREIGLGALDDAAERLEGFQRPFANLENAGDANGDGAGRLAMSTAKAGPMSDDGACGIRGPRERSRPPHVAISS